MNLIEYQKNARSTAIYLDINDSQFLYPALGLIGECGEIAEKIKKLVRDDGYIVDVDGKTDIPSNRKEAIVKELGDCCWYLANICCDTNQNLCSIYSRISAWVVSQTSKITLPGLVFKMNRHANSTATILENWYNLHICKSTHSNECTCFGKTKTLSIELSEHISHIIICIEEIAIRCGFTLNDVFVANIDKLTKRKQCGTIKGSGDNR